MNQAETFIQCFDLLDQESLNSKFLLQSAFLPHREPGLDLEIKPVVVAQK